jgi:hypothetical protein
MIVYHRHIPHGSGWWAVSISRTPSIGMRASIDYTWAIAYWVIAVKIGVIVATARVVIVAVAGRIVSPSRIAGAHEYGGGKSTAAVAVAIAIAGTVSCAVGAAR